MHRFLALLALAIPLSAIKQAPIEFPDSIGAYAKFGCQATRVTEPEKNVSWHVTVWADGAVSLARWQHLYSIRESRSAALQDCDRWMGELEKRNKRKK